MLALIKLRQNQTVWRVCLFWLAVAFLCLWALDIGLAAAVGGIAAYLVPKIVNRDKKGVKVFFLVGVCVAAFFALLFFILCLVKGIAPIDRLKEFLSVSMSNQNWAYPNYFDVDSFAFTFSYYLLPTAVILLLGIMVARYYRNSRCLLQLENESRIDENVFIVFIFFSVFYLVNLQRGIVRHSLVEGVVFIVLGTLSLSIVSVAVINQKKKRRLLRFLVAIFASMLLINFYTLSFSGENLLSQALYSESYSEQYESVYAFNGTRVEGNVRPAQAEELKQVLDVLLEPDETYFDLSSQNYFYALVGRENPVYVNQSPLMISGDAGQEYALDEIAKVSPPLVLLPDIESDHLSIDNISVCYKYYLLTEYIYQNYVPFAKVSSGYLFCMQDKKEEYTALLQDIGLLGYISTYETSFDFVNL